MKRRKGGGWVYERGGAWFVRFRVDGRDCHIPLQAASKEAALAESELVRPKFQGTRQDVIDALEGMLKRLRHDQRPDLLAFVDLDRAFSTSQRRPACGMGQGIEYQRSIESIVKFAGSCGIKHVEDFDDGSAKKYVQQLDSGELSPQRVNVKVTQLRTVWSVVRPRLMCPFKGLRSVRKVKRVGRQDFSLDQLRVILNSAPAEYADVMWLMAYTGMRLGDACNLQVQWVRFDRRVITFFPAKTKGRGDSPMPALIGIHPTIEPILRMRCGGRLSGDVFPELVDDHRSRPSKITNKIIGHFEKCGLKVRDDSAGRARAVYGTHSFRHTLQTRMNQAGVHPAISNAIICHKDGSMASVYSHVKDADVIEAIEKAMPNLKEQSGSVIHLAV